LEPRMADEARARLERGEGRVSQRVVGMDVGVDDVAHRLRGGVLDGGEQALAELRAAPGVDHRNTALANHEAEIGDVTLDLIAACAGPGGVMSGVDMDAGGDLLDRQRFEGRARTAQAGPHKGQGSDRAAQGAGARIHVDWAWWARNGSAGVSGRTASGSRLPLARRRPHGAAFSVAPRWCR